jgi:hypothetical protein
MMFLDAWGLKASAAHGCCVILAAGGVELFAEVGGGWCCSMGVSQWAGTSQLKALEGS